MDNFFIMVQMFAFAIFLLVALKIWNEFTSTDVNAELWDQTTTGTSIRTNTQRAMDNLDWIALLAYFGLHIGVIVLVFLLRSHPLVYVGGIFLIVVLVMIAVPLANAWEGISADPDFTTEISQLSRFDYIINKLPLFEMMWAFVSLICFAAFARGENLI